MQSLDFVKPSTAIVICLQRELLILLMSEEQYADQHDVPKVTFNILVFHKDNRKRDEMHQYLYTMHFDDPILSLLGGKSSTIEGLFVEQRWTTHSTYLSLIKVTERDMRCINQLYRLLFDDSSLLTLNVETHTSLSWGSLTVLIFILF